MRTDDVAKYINLYIEEKQRGLYKAEDLALVDLDLYILLGHREEDAVLKASIDYMNKVRAGLDTERGFEASVIPSREALIEEVAQLVPVSERVPFKEAIVGVTPYTEESSPEESIPEEPSPEEFSPEGSSPEEPFEGLTQEEFDDIFQGQMGDMLSDELMGNAEYAEYDEDEEDEEEDDSEVVSPEEPSPEESIPEDISRKLDELNEFLERVNRSLYGEEYDGELLENGNEPQDNSQYFDEGDELDEYHRFLEGSGYKKSYFSKVGRASGGGTSGVNEYGQRTVNLDYAICVIFYRGDGGDTEFFTVGSIEEAIMNLKMSGYSYLRDANVFFRREGDTSDYARVFIDIDLQGAFNPEL